MVTWICCPVQDSNVEIQKIFFSQCRYEVALSHEVKPGERILCLWKVKFIQKVRHLARGESDKKWQGRVIGFNKKWCDSPNFFHPHFFFNSVYPSKYYLVSSSNVTVGRNLWYAGSYWQVFFGNSCS